MGLSDEVKSSLLQAIDIIATKAASEVGFDSTIKCIIVNSDHAEDGYYTVANGNTKFTAYSENTTYKVDECVRVTIPNNDYMEKKYIIGKWAGDDGTEPITYTSAANTILEVIPLKSNETFPIGIEANGKKKSVTFKPPDIGAFFEEITDNEIFNTLFVEASFKTNLSSLKKMTGGKYGLRLSVFNKKSQLINSLVLDSSEFFGNPYAFKIPVKQSKKLSLTNFDEIGSISLDFFQDGDFHFYDENTIKKLEPLGENNIFITDLRIGIGTDLSFVEDNTIKLFCSNGLTYNKSKNSLDKEIGLLWYNKSKDNTYLGFSDGISTQDGNSKRYYDENSYLEEQQGDNNLKSQLVEGVPTDKASLDLRFKVKTVVVPTINNIYTTLSKDLPETLTNFSTRLGTSFSEIAEVINTANENIDKQKASYEKNILEGTKAIYITKTYKKGDILSKDEYDTIKYIAAINKSNKKIWYDKNTKYTAGQTPIVDLNLYFSVKQDETQDDYVVKKDLQAKVLKTLKVNLIDQQFTDIFNFGSECQLYNGGDSKEQVYPFFEPFKSYTTIQYSDIITQITNLKTIIETFKKGVSEQVATNYKSFIGIWDGWRPKFDVILQQLDAYKNLIKENLPKTITINTEELSITFKDHSSKEIVVYGVSQKNTLIPWESSFSSEQDSNLYSIYWYKYCPNWQVKGNTVLTDDEILSQVKDLPKEKQDSFDKNYLLTKDKIIFQDWKRINIAGEGWNNNIGLPTEKSENKNILYWNKNSAGENIPKFKVKLDPDAVEERFKVVIVYNHNRYESDEIVFTNNDKVINLNLTEQDRVDFEIANSTNSQDNYQDLYNFTSELIQPGEKDLKRAVIAQFKNPDDNNKEIFEKSWIYWYIPDGATMLNYNLDDLEQKKFFTDKEKTVKCIAKSSSKYYQYAMNPEGKTVSFKNNRIVVKDTKKIGSKTYACINKDESKYILYDDINFDTYKDKQIYYPETDEAVFYKVDKLAITFSAGQRFNEETILSLYKELDFFGKGKSFKQLTTLSINEKKYIYAYEYLKRQEKKETGLMKKIFGNNATVNSINDQKNLTSKQFDDCKNAYRARDDYADFEKEVIKRAESSEDKYVIIETEKKDGKEIVYYVPSMDIEATCIGVKKTSHKLSATGGTLLVKDSKNDIKKYIYLQDDSKSKSKIHKPIEFFTEEPAYINGALQKYTPLINILDVKKSNSSWKIGSIKNTDNISNIKTGTANLYIYKLMENSSLGTVKNGALVMTRSEFYDPITKKDYYKNSTGFLLKSDFIYEKPFYSRDGYFCFYKKIDSNYQKLEKKDGKHWCSNCEQYAEKCSCLERAAALEENRKFYYQIKNTFSQDATNNNIMCAIEGDRWSIEETLTTKTFSFGTYGANGTEYSIRLTPSREIIKEYPKDENGKVIAEAEKVNRLKTVLNVNLYNGAGEEQDFPEPTYSWLGPTSCLVESITKEHDDKGYSIVIKDRIADKIDKNTNFTLDSYHALLKLEIGLTEVSLETIYPVPYSTSSSYYINGATSIIYNSLGTAYNYNTDAYALYDNKNNKLAEETDVEWDIDYVVGSSGNPGSVLKKEDNDNRKKYMPTLKTEDEKTSLNPLNSYVNNVDCYPVVICYKKGTSNIKWIQPIAILQNCFESTTLNKWDNKLSINEEDGVILSSMIGAGLKNKNNSFSGVIMGDVNAKAGFGKGVINTGLYGFHEGAAAFGFDVNGTAFLGKSGKGRIVFDGNSGFIHSASWDGTISPDGGILTLGTQGTCFDLENGQIDARNFKLTSEHVNLNSNPAYGSEWLDIGNDQTYMKFTSDGALKIRVTDFELTYHTGENLLKNTAPLEREGEYLAYEQSWFAKTTQDSSKTNKNIMTVIKDDGQEEFSYIQYNKGDEITDVDFAKIETIKFARSTGDYQTFTTTYGNVKYKENISKFLDSTEKIYKDYETFYKSGTMFGNTITWTNKIIRTVLEKGFSGGKKVDDILDVGGVDEKNKYSTIGFFSAPVLNNNNLVITKSMFNKYFEIEEKGDKTIIKCKQDIWVRDKAKNTLISKNNINVKKYAVTSYQYGNRKSILRTHTGGTFTLQQKLSKELDRNKYYTLSGKIYINSSTKKPKFTFCVGGETQEKTFDTISEGTWHDIDIKFKSVGKYNETKQPPDLTLFKIQGKNVDLKGSGFTTGTLFYQLKLEEGLTATQWCQSTEEENYADKVSGDGYSDAEDFSKELDSALDSNAVFDLLTDSGKKQGIFYDEKKTNNLFVNAECIGTGLLRSNEVEGDFSYSYKNKKNAKEPITGKRSLSSYTTVVNSIETELADKGIDPEFKVTNISLTKGTIFDLRSGFMAANRFELNAWKNNAGLYINSTPYYIGSDGNFVTALGEIRAEGTDDRYYYLKLGNLNSSYVTFSGSGSLKMKVNRFELIGGISHPNLLTNTTPFEGVGYAGSDSHWTEGAPSSWKAGNSYSRVRGGYYATDDKTVLFLSNDEKKTGNDDTPRLMYQTINAPLHFGKTYTLSGYMRSYKKSRKVSFRMYDGSISSWDYMSTYTDESGQTKYTYKEIPFDKAKEWQYFEWTFKFGKSKQSSSTDSKTNKGIFAACCYATKDKDGKIISSWETSKDYVMFHHLKLEEGENATVWSENETDSFVNQNITFNKLTDGGKAQGVFLIGNQLFINATYIATGVLRSNNWKGTYSYTFEGASGTVNSSEALDTLLKQKPTAKLTGISATEGMYMNLNSGEIWADTLELNAWNTSSKSGLYLNSKPYRLNKTSGKKDPTLKQAMNANKNNFIYDSYYYFKIGNLNDSYLTFDGAGKLSVKVNKFELIGGTGHPNLLKNTTPLEGVGYSGSDNKWTENPPFSWQAGESTYSKLRGGYFATDKKTALIITNKKAGEDTKPRWMKQTISTPLIYGSTYTLSGYIRSAKKSRKVSFRMYDSQTGNWDYMSTYVDEDGNTKYTYKEISFDKAKEWQYFEWTFKFGKSKASSSTKATSTTGIFAACCYATQDASGKVISPWETSNDNIMFHHLKLEKGENATAWEEDATDSFINQNITFNRLTNGGKAQGVFLENNKLYINATYIATGILRSNNWTGLYKPTNSLTITKDADMAIYLEENPGKKIDLGDLTTTQGLFINLNEGWISAANLRILSGSANSQNFVLLSSTNFTVDKDQVVGGVTETATTASDKRKWRLAIGTGFGVTSAGRLYATGAVVSGKVSATSGTIGGWTIASRKLSAGGNGSGLLPVVVQVPTKTTSTVFAVGGLDNHSNYQDTKTRKFYVRADGYVYASSGKIGGWTINATSITSADGKTTLSPSRSSAEGGSIKGAYINGGTVYGATVSGGSLDIGNKTYYLKMGKGTAHPEMSGLNITSSGGIAMGYNGGISGCTSIGGSKGQIDFTANGVEIDTYFSIAGSGYMYVPSKSNSKRTLSEYVNEVVAANLNGETVTFKVEADGGTGTYTCTFVDGLLTSVSVNGTAADPVYPS